MDIYKLQQDRTEIQNQYDHELRQYEEISALSVDNLLALGFISKTHKGALNRLEIALNGNVVHVNIFDNRTFIFFLNNKQLNLLTLKDVINFLNYIR